MKEACAIIDDVEQLLFQNTSLMILIHGFCLMSQQDIQEMEYLVQGIDILLENQRNLQAKMEVISDKAYKTAYSELYSSISP